MLEPDKSTGCDGKIKYSSRGDAQREVRRIEIRQSIRVKRVKRGKSRLIVYSCVFCGCLHIGHTSESKRVVKCSDEEEEMYE